MAGYVNKVPTNTLQTQSIHLDFFDKVFVQIPKRRTNLRFLMSKFLSGLLKVNQFKSPRGLDPALLITNLSITQTITTPNFTLTHKKISLKY